MAKTQQRDLIARLADAGEEAIQKLAEIPGAKRFLDVADSLRGRVDELQKRMRGLDELEKRVARLEKRLAALERGKRARATASATSRAKKTT